MKLCKTKMVIVERDLAKNVLEAAKQAGIPRERVLVFDHGSPASASKDIDGLKSWRTLFDHGEADWVRYRGDKVKKAIAAFLSTSGTTGLPKAGMVTHYNLIAQKTAVFDAKPRRWEIRRVIGSPAFHAATVPTAHFTPLSNGMKVFIMRRFSVDAFLKAVQDFKITEAPLVPPMIVGVLNSPNVNKFDLSSIRYATSGAAPLGKEQQRRFKALLRKDAYVTQVWGMTETTCIASMFEANEYDESGSVGRMVANVDCKLIDDNGQDVTANDTRGEICVRGPTVIPGYFENPDANKDWDAEGYFHTGDIGVRNKDGLYFLVDRKKELIKVRGFQVAPPELEAVLYDHPAVAEAAVIGITVGQGEDKTEQPRAYVVKKDGKQVTESELAKFVEGRVAKYKRLDGGVIFMRDIPKNPSGKILKKDLREMAKKETRARL